MSSARSPPPAARPPLRRSAAASAPCTATGRRRSFSALRGGSMVGITAYGAYVPMLRLPLAAIGGGSPKPGGPEKAVANWDEESVKMGVGAADECTGDS